MLLVVAAVALPVCGLVSGTGTCGAMGLTRRLSYRETVSPPLALPRPSREYGPSPPGLRSGAGLLQRAPGPLELSCALPGVAATLSGRVSVNNEGRRGIRVRVPVKKRKSLARGSKCDGGADACSRGDTLVRARPPDRPALSPPCVLHGASLLEAATCT